MVEAHGVIQEAKSSSDTNAKRIEAEEQVLDLVDLREISQTETGVKSSLIKFRISSKCKYITLFS